MFSVTLTRHSVSTLTPAPAVPALERYAMKNYTTLASAILLYVVGLSVALGDENDPKSITAESLNTIPVIGKLGVPLGQVTKIKAIVVDGDSLRTKGDAGSYLLKITEVNGIKLDSEPIVDFSLAPGVDVNLANNNFALHELITGEEARSLTGEQIAKLKKDYVGKSILLQVYEMGGFTGIPNKMPKEVETWQDYGFHFRTYLRVLREIEAK